MSVTLQLELLLGSVCLLAVIFYMLKKNLLSVKYSLLWLFFAAALILFAAVPYVVYVLRDILNIEIPVNLVFVLLFFLGGMISGASGIIALGTPLAFAAMDGGMPLMVLLMCISHAASQVSPVHVCLVVAADYYHVSMGALIRKTLPVALLFCLLMIGYYNILLLL